MSLDTARLVHARSEIMLLEADMREVLYGRKVRFKAWLTGGKQRTGTIKWVTSGPKSPEKGYGITIGVAVDRVDGREGTLADTWYGDFISVEVVE